MMPGIAIGQHDAHERLHARRAVHEGALLDLARDRAEVAHEEPGAERNEEGRVGDHERRRSMSERPEPAHDLRQRAGRGGWAGRGR